MGFRTRFVVDRLLVHPEIHGFADAVAVVEARWIISHDDFPGGEAVHHFRKFFHHSLLRRESFVAFEDATDAVIEEWTTRDLGDARAAILASARAAIEQSSLEAGLVEKERP